MARRVKVAAFTTDHAPKSERTVEDNLDYASGIIDEIAFEKPDIICLTETFDTRCTPLDHPGMAQTPDGPTITRMAAKAREHRTYIICSYIEKREEGIFNCAAVIDRQGKIVGRYDKVHPTVGGAIGEIEDQIIPGAVDQPLIQTDFGKIACRICFDANWPEDWQALRRAGAEIIFFPSAFSAGRILQSIATIYHVPVVAACNRTCCRIVDRDGLILNYEGVYQKWVTGVIDLDNPLFHLDFQFEKMAEVRRAYGPKIHVRVYDEEGWWRIMPIDPAIDVQDIIKKYDLVPLEDYFNNCKRMQDEARNLQLSAVN